MALATNSTPGSIVLAGDLDGTASSPSLRVSGVIPGNYHPANIVVDAKGRIVWAVPSNYVNDIQPFMTDTSYTNLGLCQVYATTDTCNPQLLIVGGEMRLNMKDAERVLHHYSYNIGTIVDGVMTLSEEICGTDQATWYTPIVGDRVTAVTYETIDGVNTVTSVVNAYVTGVISNVPGNRVFQLDNASLNFNTGPATHPCNYSRSHIFVWETVSTYPGGKVTVDAVNSSLEIINDGVMKVKYATTTSKGIMQAGSGLSVTSGVLSLDPMGASGGGFGVVQIANGGGIAVDGSGVISGTFGDATDSVKGVASFGSGLAVAGGVVSMNAPDATTSSKGIVRVGSNIDVAGGVISLPIATTTTKGVVRVGSGFAYDGGILMLDNATTSAQGLVSVLDTKGIAVNAGVISIPNASATHLGYATNGTNINLAAGVISVATATNAVKGVASFGAGLSVTGGVVSLNAPDATTGSKGIIQIGSGLSVTSGTVSLNAPDATTGSKGIVQIGADLAAAGGTVSVGTLVMRTNTAQTTTAGQVHTPSALSGTSVNWDGTSNNVMTITLSATTTLNNGSNIAVGAYYHFIISGSQTLNYGTQFKFKPGCVTQPSGTKSVLSCYAVDSNTLYCIMQPNFA